MRQINAVVEHRSIAAWLRNQLWQIKACECDNRILPDGLLWLDGERQGEALRLVVSGVLGGARAVFSTEHMIHPAKRQTTKNIVLEQRI